VGARHQVCIPFPSLTVSPPNPPLCSYEGEWQSGVRHGEGRITYASAASSSSSSSSSGGGSAGGVYIGQWAGDARQGFGTLTLASGDSYTGAWERDLKHGQGRYTYASKRMVLEGEWVEGSPRCGEMRDLDPGGEEDSPATAAIAPDVRNRGELPGLLLADPLGVVLDAASTAHADFQQRARGGRGGGGGGDAAGGGEPYAVAADLGLAEDELAQLLTAFSIGEEAAQGLGAAAPGTPAGQLAGDVRVLAEVVGALGVRASEAELEGLLGTMLAVQEEAGDANVAPGMVSFQAFAACMARLRVGE
jgi:hypothetical protein